jgi:hypothetical protein
MSKALLRLLLFIAVTLVTACDGGRERTNVLTAHGEQEVAVMDFSEPFPLDPLPAGWYHRTFWTRAPMEMVFAVKDGVPSLRFETWSTASMLFRHIDFDLMEYHFFAGMFHLHVSHQSRFPRRGEPTPEPAWPSSVRG